jgi:hypothetical protein
MYDDMMNNLSSYKDRLSLAFRRQIEKCTNNNATVAFLLLSLMRFMICLRGIFRLSTAGVEEKIDIIVKKSKKQ